MNLVGGHDAEVAAWAGKMLDKHFVQPLAAHAVVDDDGHLKGAVVWNDFYQGGNIEATYMGKGTLSRRVLKSMLTYAFGVCGATRITAKTARRNFVVKKIMPRMGFVLEYTQKHYFGPDRGDDALVFVLYKNRVPKWLTGY